MSAPHAVVAARQLAEATSALDLIFSGDHHSAVVLLVVRPHFCCASPEADSSNADSGGWSWSRHQSRVFGPARTMSWP